MTMTKDIKISILSILLIILTIGQNIHAQAQPKRSMVICFTFNEAIPRDYAAYFEKELSTAIQDTSRLSLVKEEKIDALLAKSGPESITGNPTQVVPLTNSQILGIINLEAYGVQKGQIQLPFGTVKVPDAVIRLQVSADLIDLPGSKYLGTIRQDADKQISRTYAADSAKAFLVPGSTPFKNSPMGEITGGTVKAMAGRIQAMLQNTKWQCKVVDVIDGLIYGNAGTGAGISIGDEFDIIRPGKVLTDPVSGAVLGIVERQIDTLKVVSVENSYFVGKSSNPEKIERSYIIRQK